MVLVHLRLALFIKGAGFGFQALCSFLDLVLLGFVAVNLGLVLGLFLLAGRHVARQFGQRLLGAFGLEVIPLVGGFRLLDGGIVLHQPRIGLRGATHVGKDGTHRGDDGGEHCDLVGAAAMAFSAVALCRVLAVAMRGVLNGVVVGAVYVKSAGRHMGWRSEGC